VGLLKNFTKLILGLLGAVKNEDKTEIIINYLSIARNEDKLWMIYLLTGGKIKKCVSAEIIRKCALEHTALPVWLFDECLQRVGDLPETISLLIQQPESISNYSLSYWIQYIETIRSLMPNEQIEKVHQAWSILPPKDIYIFNKIAAGTIRITVNEKLLAVALSIHTGLSKNVLAKKLINKWHPQETTYLEFISNDESKTDITKPYYFFPASPLVNLPVEHTDWIAEWKWDGVRAQIIKREGELFIWSKQEELITNKFPEFDSLRVDLPNGTVLDGELICRKNNRPMPFHSLTLRLGKKNCSPKMLKDSPAAFMAHDLLEWNGNDIRNLPLQERLKILSNNKKQIINNKTILFSEFLQLNSFSELKNHRKKARSVGAAGLIIKRKDSVYKQLNNDDWLAWNAEPYVINAVLSYVNFGQGNDEMIFTFGVWSGNELVPIAKVTPVLNEKEMLKVYNFIKENTIERFGPVRTVKPELVFEIAFDGIAHSSRHKSGVVIRNPWMGRWRKDMKAKEATYIDELFKYIIS